MHLASIFATMAKTETSVADALPHLLGMLIVILTLAVLWGVCLLTATLIRAFMPAPAAPAPVVSTAPSPNTPSPEDLRKIAPEIVTVIAAAVASVTDRSHRVISIKHQSSSWEIAGRQSVLTSHRIR